MASTKDSGEKNQRKRSPKKKKKKSRFAWGSSGKKPNPGRCRKKKGRPPLSRKKIVNFEFPSHSGDAIPVCDAGASLNKTTNLGRVWCRALAAGLLAAGSFPGQIPSGAEGSDVCSKKQQKKKIATLVVKQR